MKIIFILFFFIICFSVSASITDELIKLSDMYKQGLLTETEFKKAKSILLEIQEIDNSQKEIISKEKKTKTTGDTKITKKNNKKKKPLKNTVKIERIYDTVGSKFTTKSYEKMKLTVGDFLVYTHRPGAIKIKKISNNKQLAVIGDKLNVKYYNDGNDLLDIIIDKNSQQLDLFLNDIKVLIWKGTYVQEAEATFYQILAMGRDPFHYYIKLNLASTAAAINMEKFTRKIELAVNETKTKLSNEYNISIDEIDQIIADNDMMAANNIIKSPSSEIDKLGKKKRKLYSKLKKSLGDDRYSEIEQSVSTSITGKLDKTIATEIQKSVDESIRDAINSGLEAAALEAALNAFIDALLSGKSWAEAITAGEQECANAGNSC